MRISDWSSDVCSSDLEDQRRGHDKVTEFTLTPTGRGASKRNVQITQTYDVEYGWNLLGSYAGLYVSRHVGDHMKMGLSRLSNMLASDPNIDYHVERRGMRDQYIMEGPAETQLLDKPPSTEHAQQAIQH